MGRLDSALLKTVFVVLYVQCTVVHACAVLYQPQDSTPHLCLKYQLLYYVLVRIQLKLIPRIFFVSPARSPNRSYSSERDSLLAYTLRGIQHSTTSLSVPFVIGCASYSQGFPGTRLSQFGLTFVRVIMRELRIERWQCRQQQLSSSSSSKSFFVSFFIIM